MLMINKNAGLFDIATTLSSISSKVEKTGPLDAEIVPGKEPRWFIVVTQPGHEGIAAGHLIGHRFGIYQPQEKTIIKVRGRPQPRTRNLFPTYLFVYVWDIEKHARRILCMPGVQRLLCAGDKPVAVPFHVIDHIRAEENALNPIDIPMDAVTKKKRKRRRRRGKDRTVQNVQEEIVATYSKSYWARLEEPERFDLLHKALGLPA